MPDSANNRGGLEGLGADSESFRDTAIAAALDYLKMDDTPENRGDVPGLLDSKMHSEPGLGMELPLGALAGAVYLEVGVCEEQVKFGSSISNVGYTSFYEYRLRQAEGALRSNEALATYCEDHDRITGRPSDRIEKNVATSNWRMLAARVLASELE
jgi:hypothetical protein